MICRCASKAKERGLPFFGIQFYGECWAGKNFTFPKKKKTCIDVRFKECPETGSERICSGSRWTNFVYHQEEVSVHKLFNTYLPEAGKFFSVIVKL